jgi:hypothetical protein
MAEFVFVMPVLAIIFLIMFQLYLLCNAKHMVIQGARYAAFEKAQGDKDSGQIQNEITAHILTDPKITLQSLEIDETRSWQRSTSRFSGTIGNILNGLFESLEGVFEFVPTLNPNNYFDPVTSTALFLGIPGTDINLGLMTAIGEEDDNKVEARVTCDYELEYLYHLNELGRMIGGEDMTISPVRLRDSLVVIHDDWSSKNRKEFAKRVGVPASYEEFWESLQRMFDGDFSDLYMGLWLYPVGGAIGTAFEALNIVYGVIGPLKDILETAGDIFGVETRFNDPIDPRGDYFKTDNAPDYAGDDD